MTKAQASRISNKAMLISSIVLGLVMGLFGAFCFGSQVHGVAQELCLAIPTRLFMAGYFVVVAAAASAVSYFVMRWMAHGVKTPDGPLPNKRYAIMFSLIMLAWLIWMIPHYPGTMRDDSLTQLFQWEGVCGFYDQHPLPTTVIFGVFWSIGDFVGVKEAGLFLYLLVCALFAAAVVVWAIRYFESKGLPKVWGWVACAFFALSRVIYQSVDAMSKDGLNAIFLLLCFVLVLDMFLTRGKSLKSPGRVALLCLAIFFCIATKRTMLFVLVPVLLVAICCVDGKRAKAMAAVVAIVPAVVFQCVFSPLLMTALNAGHSTTYEMWSLPVQVITGTLKENPDTFSEAELQELSEAFNYESAVQTYDPTRSDDVIWNITAGGSKATLLKYAALSCVRQPTSALRAVAYMVSTWFSFSTTIDYGHNTYEELVASEGRATAWQSSYFEGTGQTFQEFISQYSFNWVFPDAAQLMEIVDKVQASIRPLSSYGLYCTFIPLLVVLYCVCFLRKKHAWFALLPFLLLASVMVGPMTLYWYTSSFCFLAPFLLFAAKLASAKGEERPGKEPLVE